MKYRCREETVAFGYHVKVEVREKKSKARIGLA